LNLEPKSQIVITSDYEKVLQELKEHAPKGSSFELFIKDDENFLVSDANEVIANAYLASKEKVFLVLYAKNFSDVVQNRLLKIIEEPPKNKEFILITPSKSTLLATILSRLPLTHFEDKKEKIELSLDMNNLSLEAVYQFIQEHKRLKVDEAIVLVEEIIKQALLSDSFNIDEKTLALFYKVRLALDVGSPTDFVLTTLLLKLLAKKKKRVR
jgi:DNA polymerase-3 subunit delta'